jgi:hypothetical protein
LEELKKTMKNSRKTLAVEFIIVVLMGYSERKETLFESMTIVNGVVSSLELKASEVTRLVNHGEMKVLSFTYWRPNSFL